MKDVQEKLEKYVEMLRVDRAMLTPSEAEHRAGELLYINAHLSNWRYLYTNEKIKAQSMEQAVYASVLSRLAVKKITESKILVEADPEYQKAREKVESLDNDLNYFRHYQEIFNNGHIFFRQLSNTLNKGD